MLQMEFYANPNKQNLEKLSKELYYYLNKHIISRDTYDYVLDKAILYLEEIAENE